MQTTQSPRYWPRCSLLACLLVFAACTEPTTGPAPETSQTAAAAETPGVETSQAPTPTIETSPPAHAPEDAVERLHHGLDVSVHSGSVDWQSVVAEGHGFVILKATEGVDLEDGAFADHWREAAAAGLVRGAYHFYVTEDDPRQQADWFTQKVTLQPGDMAPIVDIELVGHGTEDGWQQNVLTFAQQLRDHYGVTPIVYTSPKFWQTHFQGEHATVFADFPLWIAEYGVDEPAIPMPWGSWHMWQYRGDAPIAGVEKGADLSRVNPQQDRAQLLIQ